MFFRRATCGFLVALAVAGCGEGSRTPSDGSTTTVVSTSTTASTVLPTTTTLDAREPKCATAPKKDATAPPDDWASYWQTRPASNQPLSLEICLDDVTPTVGQLVTLTVTADDPDATIGEANCDIYVSFVTSPGSDCRDFRGPTSAPEPTPPAAHGHVVKTYTYTYAKAQTYLVFVTVWSSPESGKPHPYASKADASLHVSVLP